MARRFLTLAVPAALMLCACAPAAQYGSASPPPPPPPPPPAGQCQPEGLERFVGQLANEQTGAEMLRVSGARTLRWVAPGMAVTMDYRADRLTVSYDAKMRIERLSCG